MLTCEVGVGVKPDEALDPPYPRADGGLAQQLDHAELAGPCSVRAAAQLARVVAHLDDPHRVAVLLTEQRHRPDPAGLFLRGDEGAHLQVGQRDRVDLLLDVSQDRRRDRARGGEVEAEAAGRVERAGLRRLLPERIPQRLVDQVRGGVGPAHRAPSLHVHLSLYGAADGHLTGQDPRPVHDQPGQRALHVEDLEHGAVSQHEPPAVRELPPSLGVERRAVEHDLHARALARRAGADPVDQQPPDGCPTDDLVVPGEVRGAGSIEQRAVRRDVDVASLLGPAVLLGPLPLLLHEGAEALLVDGQSLLGCHLQGQVDREAVRVVQGERDST